MASTPDLYAYEAALHAAGFGLIAGTDEAGRGACAGPLVAAAVILAPGEAALIPGLADSKLLTEAQRESCYDHILRRCVAWAVASVDPGECDTVGMQVANVSALRRALWLLDPQPDFALTDGFSVDGLPMPALAIVKGDQLAACVAAASVVAKVTRDRVMADLDRSHPQYGFAQHKGYCTAAHQRALELHGPSDTHRLRYDNVRRAAKVAMT